MYLDWNASWPLRPEAREAMLRAMDISGNPSSVHSEGRASRAIIEHARGQIAELAGAEREEVVFTSGATESINTVLGLGWDLIVSSGIEHDAVNVRLGGETEVRTIPVDFLADQNKDAFDALLDHPGERKLLIVHVANGEFGLLPSFRALAERARASGFWVLADATQMLGKAKLDFSRGAAGDLLDYAVISAHKIGGPKGVGAMLVKERAPLRAYMIGGGHEKGRRSGTENLVGIAGFGAAVEAAAQDDWNRVAELRDNMEATLTSAAPELVVIGRDLPRLPNMSNLALPGWKGETQVMQMDLAGFAISAGSACSSGKVKASRVLKAMGYDDVTASSAIRVSMGPTTTEAEVMAFADTWIEQYRRWKLRAA